jgi:hypothetical protein
MYLTEFTLSITAFKDLLKGARSLGKIPVSVTYPCPRGLLANQPQSDIRIDDDVSLISVNE